MVVEDCPLLERVAVLIVVGFVEQPLVVAIPEQRQRCPVHRLLGVDQLCLAMYHLLAQHRGFAVLLVEGLRQHQQSVIHLAAEVLNCLRGQLQQCFAAQLLEVDLLRPVMHPQLDRCWVFAALVVAMLDLEVVETHPLVGLADSLAVPLVVVVGFAEGSVEHPLVEFAVLWADRCSEQSEEQGEQ